MTAPNGGEVRSSGSRVIAVVALLAVGLAGVAGGVVLDRAVLTRDVRQSGPPSGMRGGRGGRDRVPSAEMRKQFSDRMAKELGLSPEQQVRMDTIMTRQMEGIQRASASIQPTVDSLVRDAQRAMDSVLTPAQREKVKTMRRGPRPTRGR